MLHFSVPPAYPFAINALFSLTDSMTSVLPIAVAEADVIQSRVATTATAFAVTTLPLARSLASRNMTYTPMLARCL
jgi:hypothetical protein